MPESVSIKVINQSANPLPDYQTAGASGMDIRASLEENILLKPGKRFLIPTGLFVEIPQGYEIQVRPRSGLAIKHGITCLNTPGTIDSDYRGEIKIILINLGEEDHVIENGSRIAQLVVSRVEKASLIEVQEIVETKRGTGGFGHTGKI